MQPPTEPLDLAVIGGGAAGFFCAIRFAELAPGRNVAIFEKGSRYLQKVRVSGGGRCNVTHACFDPRALAKHYPRGSRELAAAFHRWQPSDTVAWFEQHGVSLKTEPDGRMFPTTDSSETIIECFLSRARQSGVALQPQHSLSGIEQLKGGNGFSLQFENQSSPRQARAVCIATGSLKDGGVSHQLQQLEHSIEPPVPSLFAFNVSDPRIRDLAGVAHPEVAVRMDGSKLFKTGPLLITHRGFSGPAILRLSAWQARAMAALDHRFDILIDWLPAMKPDQVSACFADNRRQHGAKLVRNIPLPPIPRRLWTALVMGGNCGIEEGTTWAQLSKDASRRLLESLKSARFEVLGKTTNKEEFVTCGGVGRSGINFRTMESLAIPGLYFAGECIDIDGITGGFNFQAAWTTANIAAAAIAGRLPGG